MFGAFRHMLRVIVFTAGINFDSCTVGRWSEYKLKLKLFM